MGKPAPIVAISQPVVDDIEPIPVQDRERKEWRRTPRPNVSLMVEPEPQGDLEQPEQVDEWVQCGECTKWRRLDMAWESDSFSCKDLEDTTCEQPCDCEPEDGSCKCPS